MLINGNRELAYVVKIDSTAPIEGADRVELAYIGGWQIMVKKDQFKPGDYAIYFEIDSKVPNKPPFEFLEKCGYKIKTQKYFKSTVLSQGLLMSLDDFNTDNNDAPTWLAELRRDIGQEKDVTLRPLTKQLGVTHIEEQGAHTQKPQGDKARIAKLANKHPWLKSRFGKWLISKPAGLKLVLAIYSKEPQHDSSYPSWISKTDEERIENLPHLLGKEMALIATEKIDGSSATYALRKIKPGKYEYLVGSRNVIFEPTEENVWTRIGKEYAIEGFLKWLLEQEPAREYAILQGEIFGKGIQKRTYGMKDVGFAAFNLILSDKGRVGYADMARQLKDTGIDPVPFDCEISKMPDTIEALRELVNAKPSAIDGEMREGLVLRSADGQLSCKCVSPEYLIKYS